MLLTKVPCIPRQIVTLWSDKGATWAYEHETTRAILDAVRPQAIQLHTSAKALVDRGAQLTERVRRENPGVEVLWAIQGDGDDPKIPGFGDHWDHVSRAALACGVTEVQDNCEGKWCTRPKGSLRAALERQWAPVLEHQQLHSLAQPALILTHTAFDGPVWLPTGHHGFGESYPWKEALGPGSPVVRSAPQVYWAVPGGEDLPPGRGKAREATHEASWKAGERKGLFRPDLVVDSYQQAYNCRVDELCLVASDNPNTYWWTVPTAVDVAGVMAMACMAELFRRRQTIAEFQTAAGLTADWKVGPRTRAEILGASWKAPRTVLK